MMMIQVSQCLGDIENEIVDILDFQERSSHYDILKQNLPKIRHDMFHQEIVKKEKNHSISFRDEVKSNYGLVDIIIVENWKDYNIISEDDIRDNCSCNIL
ncbi:unnamed protein product [Paramecium pentaurelia]|uniref:Uncharacterized protein n=1 Tax=Paramecium pentaurelia TaxID=43138 RepID=A0A8S1T867_9CILI|nr:unnamed protein product [Paramecium pentaurelia]